MTLDLSVQITRMCALMVKQIISRKIPLKSLQLGFIEFVCVWGSGFRLHYRAIASLCQINVTILSVQSP